MSEQVKKRRSWLSLALMFGAITATNLFAPALWHAAPATVQTAILWAASIALAAILIVSIRAVLRD